MRVAPSSASAVSVLADDVLAHAREVEVVRTTPQELGRLLPGLSSTDVQGVERHGLAAFLVAAPKLERKLRTRSHEGGPPSPQGRAVVDAAIDWALCGRTDAITEQALQELCSSHSAHGTPVSADEFAAARDWALRPVAGTVALLHRVPGGYEPFDYVVALARETRVPEDRAWAAAIGTATDAQALAVGVAAFGHSRLDDAVDAFARASTSATREIAALAAYNKGVSSGCWGARRRRSLSTTRSSRVTATATSLR